MPICWPDVSSRALVLCGGVVLSTLYLLHLRSRRNCHCCSSKIAFDWNQELEPCGLWNCPFEENSTLDAAIPEQLCSICFNKIPFRGLLKCPFCQKKICLICQLKSFFEDTWGESEPEETPLWCPACLSGRYNSLAREQFRIFYIGHKEQIHLRHAVYENVRFPFWDEESERNDAQNEAEGDSDSDSTTSSIPLSPQTTHPPEHHDELTTINGIASDNAHMSLSPEEQPNTTDFVTRWPGLSAPRFARVSERTAQYYGLRPGDGCFLPHRRRASYRTLYGLHTDQIFDSPEPGGRFRTFPLITNPHSESTVSSVPYIHEEKSSMGSEYHDDVHALIQDRGSGGQDEEDNGENSTDSQYYPSEDEAELPFIKSPFCSR